MLALQDRRFRRGIPRRQSGERHHQASAARAAMRVYPGPGGPRRLGRRGRPSSRVEPRPGPSAIAPNSRGAPSWYRSPGSGTSMRLRFNVGRAVTCTAVAEAPLTVRDHRPARRARWRAHRPAGLSPIVTHAGEATRSFLHLDPGSRNDHAAKLQCGPRRASLGAYLDPRALAFGRATETACRPLRVNVTVYSTGWPSARAWKPSSART